METDLWTVVRRWHTTDLRALQARADDLVRRVHACQEPSVPEIRCSDADREEAARALKHAMVDGRITQEELEQRLDVVLVATLPSQLRSVTEDIPPAPPAPPPPAPACSRTEQVADFILEVLERAFSPSMPVGRLLWLLLMVLAALLFLPHYYSWVVTSFGHLSHQILGYSDTNCLPSGVTQTVLTCLGP